MSRLVAFFLIPLAGCGGPALCRCHAGAITPEAAALAGSLAAPALEARCGGVIRDVDAERRMERAGERLVWGTSGIRGRYQYRLCGSDAANAFSLPGGRVYLTRGLYERLDTNERLAAVLAHEIAHITAEDHFRPRSGTSADALDREVIADTRAVAYLRAAGISSGAMVDVIRFVGNELPHGWSHIREQSVSSSAGHAELCAFHE